MSNLRLNKKRKINIDPGYVNNKEVVLASFKYRGYKEFIGNGIYAHKIMELYNKKIKYFNTGKLI